MLSDFVVRWRRRRGNSAAQLPAKVSGGGKVKLVRRTEQRTHNTAPCTYSEEKKDHPTNRFRLAVSCNLPRRFSRKCSPIGWCATTSGFAAAAPPPLEPVRKKKTRGQANFFSPCWWPIRWRNAAVKLRNGES